MEEFIQFSAKTKNEAITKACIELGVSSDQLEIEVVSEGSSGFFGIGSKPAIIKARKINTVSEEDEIQEIVDTVKVDAIKEEQNRKPAKPFVKAEKPAPKSEPVKEKAPVKEAKEPKPFKEPKEKQPRQPKENKPRQEKPRQPKPQQPKKEAAPAEPKVYTPAEPGSTEERIEQFVKGLLEHMGSDAVPHAMKTADESYSVDLVGENLGILIGRRGETLDAIQHLANYAVNRGQNKRVRINVDAENYRLKREESLQRLAQKVASKVTKYRRNITLEPMNAYERHVIHAALQDYPDVTTYSTGTEPNRRIVVAYSRYKNTEFEEK